VPWPQDDFRYDRVAGSVLQSYHTVLQGKVDRGEQHALGFRQHLKEVWASFMAHAPPEQR
jgi:hypothetical protein